MEKSVIKKLKNAFYNYEQNMKKAAETSSAIDSGLVAMYGGVRVQGGNDNGREKAIIAAINKECELWRWCYVVEKTLDYFYIDGKDEYIRMRYFKRLPRREICEKCNISDRTYDYWNNDVLSVAEHWAKVYKLLDDKEMYGDDGK